MDLRSLIVNAASVADQAPVDESVAVNHVHRTEHSSTVIAVIRPGAGLRPHLHRDHDEIIVFLRGEATFRMGDHTRQVSANDVITVPAGVAHATVRAETECLIVAAFSPAFDLTHEDRVYVDDLVGEGSSS